jgi:adenylosuccinate lyase
MIVRYSRPKMSALWSEEAQYRTWLDVEVLACEGWAKLGKIDRASMAAIHEKAGFDIVAIHERERVTKHDVAAFVSVVQERIGEAGRFVHLGLTSSDVVDTAFAVRMKASGALLLEGIDELLDVTKRCALRDKDLVAIGRTHGIHAEPMSFGAKWLGWHAMLVRARQRLVAAIEEVAVGKLSGAVGNYALVPPEIEAYVCEKLGLVPDALSTQVIARDRFASYFAALGLLGSVVETVAVELRHLQRTEVGEVREGFSSGQKGSSAMPHKRNPISAENLTGLARLLRGYVVPAMENCALWHERDISHSSVERVIAPDANILADYMLWRLKELLARLEVFPERMRENLEKLQGVVFSQQVLLALVEAGLSRDEAYQAVQRNALAALDRNVPFRTLLEEDRDVQRALKGGDLAAVFDSGKYLKHTDYLFRKVLGS